MIALDTWATGCGYVYGCGYYLDLKSSKPISLQMLLISSNFSLSVKTGFYLTSITPLYFGWSLLPITFPTNSLRGLCFYGTAGSWSLSTSLKSSTISI